MLLANGSFKNAAWKVQLQQSHFMKAVVTTLRAQPVWNSANVSELSFVLTKKVFLNRVSALWPPLSDMKRIRP